MKCIFFFFFFSNSVLPLISALLVPSHSQVSHCSDPCVLCTDVKESFCFQSRTVHVGILNTCVQSYFPVFTFSSNLHFVEDTLAELLFPEEMVV